MTFRAAMMLLAVGAVGSALTADAQPRTSEGDQRTLITLPDGAIALLPRRANDISLPALIVLLHGAGQTPETLIDRFATDPDCADAVLLAPKSRTATWDIIAMAGSRALSGLSLNDDVFRYTGSRDGVRVAAAMTTLRTRIAIDETRQTLLGFSDGATFALGFGTGRAQPFHAVVAIAPGLATVAARPARDRVVLVMHGRADRALPFEITRSRIVPMLRTTSLSVRFVPFDGGHEIPDRPLSAIGLPFHHSSRKLRRIRNPAGPLFSGWHWNAVTLPDLTAAQMR